MLESKVSVTCLLKLMFLRCSFCPVPHGRKGAETKGLKERRPATADLRTLINSVFYDLLIDLLRCVSFFDGISGHDNLSCCVRNHCFCIFLH